MQKGARKRSFALGSTVLVGMVVGASALTRAASPALASGAGLGAVKYAPGMTMQSLVGRADTDRVEFADGRSITVGQLRRLQTIQQRMRAAVPGSKLPAALRLRPAGSGTPVRSASDLAAALKRPDGDTITLPGGQRTTVGLIRFLQPIIEKRLGRTLDAASPTAPAGPPVLVSKTTTEAEWRAIMQKPENTILQLPSGTQISIGAWRAGLMQFAEARKRPSSATGAVPGAKTPPAVAKPKGKR